jgi:hypothetical protein
MSGMGNIDPALLRNSANMMKGMKEEELENFKNMVNFSSIIAGIKCVLHRHVE